MKKIIISLLMTLILFISLVGCVQYADVDISALELETSPKSLYQLNEQIDIRDQQLKVVYQDGTSRIVALDKSMLDNARLDTLGRKKIVVTYKEGKRTANTVFEVFVFDKANSRVQSCVGYVNGLGNHNEGFISVGQEIFGSKGENHNWRFLTVTFKEPVKQGIISFDVRPQPNTDNTLYYNVVYLSRYIEDVDPILGLSAKQLAVGQLDMSKSQSCNLWLDHDLDSTIQDDTAALMIYFYEKTDNKGGIAFYNQSFEIANLTVGES